MSETDNALPSSDPHALGLSPPALERLSQVLDVNLTFAFENPRLFELMFLTPREGARQYPRDFRAEKSPTANVFADLIREGIASGYFRKTTDVWAIVFETGALWQGLDLLPLEEPSGQVRERFYEMLGAYRQGLASAESRPVRRWWTMPAWQMAAAAVLLAAGLGIGYGARGNGQPPAEAGLGQMPVKQGGPGRGVDEAVHLQAGIAIELTRDPRR